MRPEAYKSAGALSRRRPDGRGVRKDLDQVDNGSKKAERR